LTMQTFYLDEWLGQQIKAEATTDTRLESNLRLNQGQLIRDSLEIFQLRKLQQIVTYGLRKSPFYRDLFAKHAVHPSMLLTLADLQRFPFTEPADIIKDPYRFLCVPMGDIARIVTLTTSGSTGEKKRIFFTDGDLRRIMDLLAANTRTVLGDEKGVVQIMLPGGTVLGQADALAKGVAQAGSTPVVTGITSDIEKQIESITAQGSTTLVGYTYYLHRLTKLAREKAKLRDLGVKALVTTGEPIPVSVRDELEQAWQAKVWCHYGLTEMGFNAGMGCAAGSGYHIHEGDYYAEVIEPHTGQSLPDGAEGELVMTTLARVGMPLIRYRTGDLARIVPEKCTCGSLLKKIDMITKRMGTGINLGTKEVYPSSFDESLFSLPPVLDYRLAVKEDRDGARLTFFVELVGSHQATPAIQGEIGKAIARHPLLRQDGQSGKILFEVKFPATLGNAAGQFKRPGLFVDP